MKTHANTLYVTIDGGYIARTGQTLQIRQKQQTLLSVPIHTIEGLVCFGRISVTPPAMAFCAENDVAVTFLSTHGRFLSRLVGPTSGNVQLRRQQYEASARPGLTRAIAAGIVTAKVANARTVLLRAARESSDAASADRLRSEADAMAPLLQQLPLAPDTDVIRGIEGEGAQHYFRAFDDLLTAPQPEMRFTGRSRRPPMDNVNAVLSLLYTLLMHDCRSACETVGLDPQVGFLHRDRPGRCSLALDLMEALRAPLVDRLTASLINRRQLQPRDFTADPAGGVSLTDKGRKTLLTAYQKRKQDSLTHPFLSEKTTLGIVPFIQAQLMARFLRGDLDAYPAFFWK
jgi:CRISPR-associated protein Cas1